MGKVTYIASRGDIVWIDFSPVKGHEQNGRRPVIILTPKEYNSKTRMALVCPLTKQVKGYPFEVVYTGKKVSGAVLVDQVRSVAFESRDTLFIEKADEGTVSEIKLKLLALISG